MYLWFYLLLLSSFIEFGMCLFRFPVTSRWAFIFGNIPVNRSESKMIILKLENFSFTLRFWIFLFFQCQFEFLCYMWHITAMLSLRVVCRRRHRHRFYRIYSICFACGRTTTTLLFHLLYFDNVSVCMWQTNCNNIWQMSSSDILQLGRYICSVLRW